MNAAIMGTPKIRCVRAGYIVGSMFLASLVFGLVVPIGLLIWRAVTPQVVIRTGDAGAFISASGQSGFMQRALTNVQTTRGTLIFYGLFSAGRGQKLEVVDLNKESATQLCVAGDLNTCLPLAAKWSDAMTPAPSPGREFNFARYGLANGNLQVWLLIGILASISLGFVFSDLVATDRGGESECTKESDT